MSGTVIVLVSSGWLLTVLQLVFLAVVAREFWRARQQVKALRAALEKITGSNP